jgi:SpoVK/Ycf46/Vps4 family AAA+-type ATPase
MSARKPTAPTTVMELLPIRGGDNVQLSTVVQPKMALDDLRLAPDVRATLDSFVLEHRHAKELVKHGLQPAWGALFVGEPGTGKTSSAGALATALGVPLVMISCVVSEFMGTSERNIRKVFQGARELAAVYLLDEIDGIGAGRGGDGPGAGGKEYNLLLTSILSCIDAHAGPGIVIGTTNRVDMIDPALRRRFDLELKFPLPDHGLAIALAREILDDDGNPELVLGPLDNKSHADVVRLARAERKRRILSAIVASATKRARARKPPAPGPATPGTDTPPSHEPWPRRPRDTSTSQIQARDGTSRDRAPGADDRSRAPATPSANELAIDTPDDQGTLPL